MRAQTTPKEATVSLNGGELKYLYAASTTTGSGPLLVGLAGAPDEATVRQLFAQWQPVAASRGWNFVAPLVAGVSDPAAKALEIILADAKKRLPGVDSSRVYLAGQGASASEVFYALAREPQLWAAGLAVHGSPGAAINSYRLFGANTQEAPLLWIADPSEVDLWRAKLSSAEFNFEARSDAATEGALDWLAKHQRPEYPAIVDCETGNPMFGRCYWIEMTKFDPKKRNDALKSTRVMPGSGASLSIGPFGYDMMAQGPGALVTWLPPSYQGPLQVNDRLVSIAGKEVQNGRDYMRQMEEIKEEKPVAVVVQRGKDRVRLESKIVLPKREELITARAQGRYLADQKELFIITRAVTQLRLHLPNDWAPVSVSWNGLDVLKTESGGCWTLSIEKDPPEAHAESNCP